MSCVRTVYTHHGIVSRFFFSMCQTGRQHHSQCLSWSLHPRHAVRHRKSNKRDWPDPRRGSGESDRVPLPPAHSGLIEVERSDSLKEGHAEMTDYRTSCALWTTRIRAERGWRMLSPVSFPLASDEAVELPSSADPTAARSLLMLLRIETAAAVAAAARVGLYFAFLYVAHVCRCSGAVSPRRLCLRTFSGLTRTHHLRFRSQHVACVYVSPVHCFAQQLLFANWKTLCSGPTFIIIPSNFVS